MDARISVNRINGLPRMYVSLKMLIAWREDETLEDYKVRLKVFHNGM